MALEEGGKAVNTFLDSMKSQPLSLALVIMNLGLLGFLYYNGQQAATFRDNEMKLLYENRNKTQELLANCYPSRPRPDQ